ncbi:hypothetical protein A2X44_03700 [candidate division CPR3 bacterium GWF2_35_18]|uniref:Uncharacterized protein n=1 Tax=candidate division CPR3 bacterium GW2011_GWF2_35_18 TaxID=1618350 RepID=A0A0G0BJN8_UNCC3|nr:MAG: hypothetical protein UR67_C0004G0030 [candidate division CPR3 bacterium GW2011_GWF2_35_18]KKP87064.1 MAG: hypothetical protein UR87_C0005G0003 [candidate division CPR3 bacterium GW2011_GWE2_35_7]OGB63117.1 MAG: hypothetical protein A2X44_03700 [candidate division CPR3 bacterium GWF2_35_18]OGB64069.1 MAG: hypothetical protein A2250_04690 [candidate division CPR3 bacterium RIFOXYA2_FULL_35_13]OGB75862.1 MAG: hypothetical protein A2476_02115 [candidate division CPR3 bacterium RIFOXYC2_FULL
MKEKEEKNKSIEISFKIKTSCHFKQIEDDSCFAYGFANKRECQTCWKRYRFVSEYTPAKKEYEARFERSGQLRDDKLRKFMSWGGGIVTNDERIKA